MPRLRGWYKVYSDVHVRLHEGETKGTLQLPVCWYQQGGHGAVSRWPLSGRFPSIHQERTPRNINNMTICERRTKLCEFLKHAPCMQKVQPEYELCSKKYHRTTQEIERSNHTASLNASLKSLCCGFKEFLECSHHTVRRQCGDDTAQFAKEFLDRMSISLLKEHCGAYTEKVCSIGSDANTLRASTMVAVVLAVLARYFT
ncbi:uncharacterized protein LOC117601980 isoform X4 [Osmia lignaria lignaria]|uniref:uncharacterized protein LOC117601980 isoform X4 n=1 Tax=Osmia lignaria lignaria TaxID=1437193 RepID=UPI0014789521|nr:uncharacterized protein LOC117601980 isoform X3 [Osmia lignaria]